MFYGKKFMAVYLGKFHKTVSKLKQCAEEIIGQLNKTRFDKLVTFMSSNNHDRFL